MRRVDRPTNALRRYQPNNRPTDRPMDTASYSSVAPKNNPTDEEIEVLLEWKGKERKEKKKETRNECGTF